MQKKNYLVVVVVAVACLILLFAKSFYFEKGLSPKDASPSGDISQERDNLLPGVQTQNMKNGTEKKILSEGMHRSNV